MFGTLKLRTICDPATRTNLGEHKHLCPHCGTCWKHDNRSPQASHEAFVIAHSCPTCGAEVRKKHRTRTETAALNQLAALMGIDMEALNA
jgi:predicted RNA-binding Zn-ribbon protein involved in translation (DUF1610 family)